MPTMRARGHVDYNQWYGFLGPYEGQTWDSMIPSAKLLVGSMSFWPTRKILTVAHVFISRKAVAGMPQCSGMARISAVLNLFQALQTPFQGPPNV